MHDFILNGAIKAPQLNITYNGVKVKSLFMKTVPLRFMRLVLFLTEQRSVFSFDGSS